MFPGLKLSTENGFKKRKEKKIPLLFQFVSTRDLRLQCNAANFKFINGLEDVVMFCN